MSSNDRAEEGRIVTLEQERTGDQTVSRERRIAFLDGVRGVSAGIVVLQHLLAQEYPAYRQWSIEYIDFGRVGVVAFFLVSGYVIPLSLGGQTLRVFVVRRFFRLYPVYWVAFGLYVLVNGRDLSTASVVVVLLNLVLVQGLVGAVSILPVAWTLSIELLFYAQSAAAKARRLLDVSVHAGWAWLALYAALRIAEVRSGVDLPVTLPLLMYCAALGQAAYLRDTRGSRAWQPLLVCGLLAVPLGAYASPNVGEWLPFTYSTSFLAGLLVFVGFYVRRHAHLPRSIVWLGTVSYALYLFHPLVLDGLELTGLERMGMVVTSLLLVLVVSQIASATLERPSQNIGRRLTGTRRGGPADFADQAAP